MPIGPSDLQPRRAVLLHSIVGRFFGDDDVVDVALAQAGGGDAEEAGLCLQLVDVAGAAVAHAALQTADQLVDEIGDRAFGGDAAFDALGNKLAAGFLGVPVAAALRHGAHRAHAAVGLERAALIEDGFAGAFVGAGEKAADHDAIGAGGESLGDIAGIFDAAIGDQRDVGLASGARAFRDGGDLRNAGAGNYARGADRAGADSDLDSIDAEGDQVHGALVGGDVAGDELHFGQLALDGFDGVEHAGAVAVGPIEGEHVALAFDALLCALEESAGGAERGPDAQAALRVLGRFGVIHLLLNVFDGDEALELRSEEH